MAESAKTDATPPATSGGIDQKAMETFVATAIGAALKPIAEQLGQVKTLGEQLSGLTSQVGELAKPKEEKGKKEEIKPLGSEDVAKIVADAIKADRTATAQASATSEKKTAARLKVIEAKGLKNLDPLLLAGLPDSDDEAAITAAADKIVAAANKAGIKLADVGGAGKEGGTGAASAAAAAASAGAAKQGFLQMPGTPGGAAAA